MPKLIPNVPTQSIKHRSERDVLDALLSSLPDACVIFHGLETLTHRPTQTNSKSSQFKQGEVDVIIFWPDKGLLAIEVKGGQQITCNGNQWQSQDRGGHWNKISDPFQQARGNMWDAVNIIKQYCGLGKGEELSFSHGYAVVFPDARFDNGQVPASEDLPANAQPHIVCDSRKMSKIDAFVKQAIDAFGHKKRSAGGIAEDKQNVKNALSPALNLVPCLRSQLRNNEVEFQKLTDQQTDIVYSIESTNLASVPGVAGSGKTFVATELARRYASAGKRTLMLCYNKALASWLSEHMKLTQEYDIDVFCFHDFCETITRKAGGHYEPPASSAEKTAFFEDESSSLLMDHAEQGDGLYDAIIVDEGQDFREAWWIAIQACIRKDGYLAVFHDSRQDVFAAHGLAELEPLRPTTLPLMRNCRNTQAIADFCYEYAGINARVSDYAPYGARPIIEVEPNKRMMRSQVLHQLKDWLEEGLAASQIVVISPFRLENSCLESIDDTLGLSLVTDVDEWRQNKGILVTTARSFKGLEADIVLLIDAVQPDTTKAFTYADFYVACSRARNLLHIIAREKLVPIKADQAA